VIILELNTYLVLLFLGFSKLAVWQLSWLNWCFC